MRQFGLKPKSIYSELLVKKIRGWGRISNSILLGQTLKEQKIKHDTLATLCLFQGTTPLHSTKMTSKNSTYRNKYFKFPFFQ